MVGNQGARIAPNAFVCRKAFLNLPIPRRGAGHRSNQRIVSMISALALLCSGVATQALAQSTLPALGDTASDDFNLGTERKLGDQIMREIRRDPDYLDDQIGRAHV